MTSITLTRTGPLTTLQDEGRFGMLKHGISASGPMDRGAYRAAGVALGEAGTTAIELAQGVAFEVDGELRMAAAGGQYKLSINGSAADWPSVVPLKAGDHVEVAPGAAGNYGYLRFDHEVEVAPVLGSRATNVTVGLGGYRGRALKAGDVIQFGTGAAAVSGDQSAAGEGPIRVIWGIHADLLDHFARQRFAGARFRISPNLDRMGVRLFDVEDVFASQRQLNLVSDPIVPGDIQILGDGTPIVLMRDHQPTGGYPRIATIVTADFDRFAQMRPGTEVSFRPVTLDHAR